MSVPGTRRRHARKLAALKILELDDRRKQALALIVKSGGHDGDHHKAWVLDQVCRILTGCPIVKKTAQDCYGKDYEYDALGESDEYKELVRDARAGEDGPNTHSWDEGIPP